MESIARDVTKVDNSTKVWNQVQETESQSWQGRPLTVTAWVSTLPESMGRTWLFLHTKVDLWPRPSHTDCPADGHMIYERQRDLPVALLERWDSWVLPGASWSRDRDMEGQEMQREASKAPSGTQSWLGGTAELPLNLSFTRVRHMVLSRLNLVSVPWRVSVITGMKRSLGTRWTAVLS